ncbi:MAG TPA: FAD-binding oxidoreductase [Jiangellaceae bacterium]|nr:FAD-binding oxidoreductase [Jiangellaceae bacterium]
MQTSTATTDLISRLRSSIDGAVITPADTDYDRVRTVFMGTFDGRPAAVARPADDADVARIITLAADSGIPLAVRNGGHSGAGHSTNDDGIVLDVRDLNEVRIDAESMTAWAQSGVTAGAYLAASAEHGLATGFGDTATVGIGGITLAGGVGYLSRKYGMTIDELLAAEIVTADGQRLRVEADNHPDLFWAIRGGGGNFGVATRFKYRLRDVSQFTGGMLILPATPEVITRFVAEADAAPDELSTIMMAMVAPPMPFLPPEVHGQLIVMGQMAYVGPAEDAERAMAPFRAIATPMADMVGPKSYLEMFPPEQEGYRPIAASRNFFADAVDQSFAEAVVESLSASSAMMSAVQFRVLGGAIARVPADATAFAHRNRQVMINVAAMTQDLAGLAEQQVWVTKLAERLQQGPGVYTGFLGTDGQGRIGEAYPPSTYERLVAVKRQYDPANLFRSNHNIVP